MKLFAFAIAGLVAGGLLLDPVGLLFARVERASPGVLFRVDTDERIVALTIDDGPSEATGEILGVLEEHNVGATFFLIGDHVRERPAVVRRILDAGHGIGHHMRTDEPSIRLSPERFAADFDATEAVLKEFGGTRWFRPGSGWYDDAMVEAVEARGYRLALGSVYPFDAHVPVAWLLRRWVLGAVEPGSVIVLHDGAQRGRRTAEVLRTVLPELARRGYRVVPLSTLAPGPAPTAR